MDKKAIFMDYRYSQTHHHPSCGKTLQYTLKSMHISNKLCYFSNYHSNNSINPVSKNQNLHALSRNQYMKKAFEQLSVDRKGQNTRLKSMSDF